MLRGHAFGYDPNPCDRLPHVVEIRARLLKRLDEIARPKKPLGANVGGERHFARPAVDREQKEISAGEAKGVRDANESQTRSRPASLE